MEQLQAGEWHNVPDHLMPLFLHHCMDRMCSRNGGGMEQLVPHVFADEDSFEAAVEFCQQCLAQWIDIRDKKDVSLPNPLMQLFFLLFPAGDPVPSALLLIVHPNCILFCSMCTREINSTHTQVAIAMHDEKKKVIYECLECRRPELRTCLMAGIVRDSRKGFVVDYDWKVNYVFSSSSVSGINEPIAVITFSLSSGQTCTLDLSLTEIDLLLQTLKQVQTSVQD